MDVIHTAVAVSDIEETLAFYTDGLDLEYAHEFELNGVRNVYVAGENGMEIQFKHDPDRTDEIDPSGIDHLAVEVESVPEAFEELLAATDGYVVELVEYLD
jgi:lactoylglutathione lyase